MASSLRDRQRKTTNGFDKENDPIYKASVLKKNLEKEIFSQGIAVASVVDAVKNKVIFSDNSPKYTFFFLGPPATGKTHMAKLISQSFDEYKFLDLNMTSFQAHNTGQFLFGTEKGWSTESNGMLTSFVKNNPKTVILFDEFEKAHTNIQTKLLSIFSNGSLSDALGWLEADLNDLIEDEDGDTPFNSSNDSHKNRINEIKRTIDFSETIVIFTSNLGSSIYNNHDFLDTLEEDAHQAETIILQALAKEEKKEADEKVAAIVPEMLSRISQGSIVLFDKLDMDALLKVSIDSFKESLKTITQKFDLKFSFNKKNVTFFYTHVLRFAPEPDIRRIKSKIYEQFTDKLTDYLMDNDMLWSDIDAIEIQVDLKVEQFVRREIKTRIKKDELLKYMFRRNYTLKLKDSVIKQDRKLIYTINDAEFEKIKKAEDLSGDGAITFDIPDVKFDDIDGHIEPIKRLKEIANLLKNPKQLKNFNAKIPKGMLLFGKPGTGKTMLASALANYADLPFIATTANELIDFSKNDYTLMKKIFDRAKEYAPSIIFIDEIDTFGNRENGGSISAINELLTQINGFDDNTQESVFIIAATNYKDRIDDAILRAGRIELHVEIPTLDIEGRTAFIDKILQKPVEKNIDAKKLLMYTYGMTGAQLEKIANESALHAIRTGKTLISEESLIEQINIEKYGKRVTNKTMENELREVAFHEAGHAVISSILMPSVKIEQITITPRENSLGFVSFNMENSSSNLSKTEIEAQICIAYAGRLAQVKEYKEEGLDTGAVSDLNIATRRAYELISIYGMDKEFGAINTSKIELSDIYKAKIDIAVSKLLKELEQKTISLIDDHWDKINSLASTLMEKEVIHEHELLSIMK